MLTLERQNQLYSSYLRLYSGASVAGTCRPCHGQDNIALTTYFKSSGWLCRDQTDMQYLVHFVEYRRRPTYMMCGMLDVIEAVDLQ